MPVIAYLLAVWQRRRVLSALREARAAWAARTPSRASAEGHRPDTWRRLGRLGARGWRAVDTPANAARIQRLVGTVRAAAARAEADRTPAPTV
jgi:hypothetical protein